MSLTLPFWSAVIKPQSATELGYVPRRRRFRRPEMFDPAAENTETFGPRLKVDFQNDGAAEIEQRRSLSWLSLSLDHPARKDERNAMAVQTDQLHAMIVALAGSQALLMDVLRRRGSIAQDDIDYILTVTEQGIGKVLGSEGPQAVVQMIRLSLQQLSTSE